MGYPDTFEGFCVAGPKTWNDFKKQELKPKPFGPNDIDVQIEACGVCGSDVHTITGGWGDYEGPLCVGHEVVGKAVKVGKDVKVCVCTIGSAFGFHDTDGCVQVIKEGDRVGVGAQVWACLKCPQCKASNENYCPHMLVA